MKVYVVEPYVQITDVLTIESVADLLHYSAKFVTQGFYNEAT